MICNIANIRIVRALGPLLAGLVLATACQPAQSRSTSSPTARPSGAASASPSASVPPSHVFLIVREPVSIGAKAQSVCVLSRSVLGQCRQAESAVDGSQLHYPTAVVDHARDV